MRLLAGPGGTDPLQGLLAARREAPAGRPWVTGNMVASIDGATAVDGESRGLSGPADRRVFHALRGLADAVMAGAGTVRADRYGPARPSPEVRRDRRARGQAEVPAVVVVTRSLELDWSSPLVREAEVPTVVAAPRDAPAAARARVPGAVDLVLAGDGDVDLAGVMDALARRGVRHLLCEGGPGLLGQLTGAGLLDELYLTVAPRMVAGDARRAMTGPALHPPAGARLAAAAEEDDFLFLRYEVTR
jgi:riboflavin-specific deaminase-like protein